MTNHTYRPCLSASDAHLRLYKRLYLWDKDATLQPGYPICNFGNIRLGMPPYHAQLNIQMRGSLTPLPLPVVHSGRFIGGYFRPTESAQLFWDTMGALHSYSLARDKVLVRTASRAPAASGQHRSGDLVAGDWVDRDRTLQ